jgi:hypothetical protein
MHHSLQSKMLRETCKNDENKDSGEKLDDLSPTQNKSVMHKIEQSYTCTFDPLLLSQQESPSVGLITKKNTSCYSRTTYISI